MFRQTDGQSDLDRCMHLRMGSLKTGRPDVSADCGLPCGSLCTERCDHHVNIHVQQSLATTISVDCWLWLGGQATANYLVSFLVEQDGKFHVQVTVHRDKFL